LPTKTNPALGINNMVTPLSADDAHAPEQHSNDAEAVSR